MQSWGGLGPSPWQFPGGPTKVFDVGLGVGSVLVPKWAPKSSSNWPEISPKLLQQFVFFGFIFWEVLELLLVTFGSLLALPKALLRGLWTLKTIKNFTCFSGFWKVSFSLLRNS